MTSPMLRTEQETEIFASDTDSDYEEAYTIKTIKPKKLYSFCKFRCIASMAVIVILIATVFSGIYIYESMKSTDAKVTDYVLPNTTLTIVTSDNVMITGRFTVDEIKYNFVSISNNSIEYIEFQQISQSVTNQKWKGFKIYHLNDKHMTIELINFNTKPYIIKMDHTKGNMSSSEVQLLESFLGNILCQNFVQLSVKLGSIGFSGPMNQPIADIHRFAQWMWSVVLDDQNIDNSDWVDLTEEFVKVNTMTTGSLDKGHDESSRKLLSNCGTPYSYCNNQCHGMCGKGCSCWKWVCGTCDCHAGCRDHDEICCINGYWSYCCLNIFWVTCDGNQTCMN